jgi:hypothetical protein
VFHSQDGLFFTRNDDGSVTLTKTDGKPKSEGGKVIFEQTVDAGTWVSIGLTMSAFNERPGDYHVWVRHHQGGEDILEYHKQH